MHPLATFRSRKKSRKWLGRIWPLCYQFTASHCGSNLNKLKRTGKFAKFLLLVICNKCDDLMVFPNELCSKQMMNHYVICRFTSVITGRGGRNYVGQPKSCNFRKKNSVFLRVVCAFTLLAASQLSFPHHVAIPKFIWYHHLCGVFMLLYIIVNQYSSVYWGVPEVEI